MFAVRFNLFNLNKSTHETKIVKACKIIGNDEPLDLCVSYIVFTGNVLQPYILFSASGCTSPVFFVKKLLGILLGGQDC